MATRKTAVKHTKTKPEVKTIMTVERKLNSLNGNPQFTVYFSDGTRSVTQKDAACAYNLVTPNPEYVAPNKVLVTYERGQIATLEAIPD